MMHSFWVIFHDTAYPSPNESDQLDELKESGWKVLTYGRKYDGVRFELGSTFDRNKQDPITKEVMSPEFDEWLNNRYGASGRTNAEFCSILVKG